MTPQQQRFIEEYMIDLNATQVAIRAGYSEKTAAETGYENLRKPQTAEAVGKAKAELSEKSELSAQWVIDRLREVAEHCMKEESYNATGAARALELIGKHFNAFPDRKDINLDGEVVQRVINAEPMSEGEWEREYGNKYDA